MITLNKLLSIKIKKFFFFSVLNEVKEFYKRKFEKKLFFFKSKCYKIQLLVAFSDVFRGYSNATLGWDGLESSIANTTYENPKFWW